MPWIGCKDTCFGDGHIVISGLRLPDQVGKAIKVAIIIPDFHDIILRYIFNQTASRGRPQPCTSAGLVLVDSDYLTTPDVLAVPRLLDST